MRAAVLGALLAAFGAVLAGPAAVAGQSAGGARSETFSDGIEAWEHVPLDRRQTSYDIVVTGGDSVLVATSADAASGLVWPVRLPEGSPMRLRWRWRVHRSLDGNRRERTRDGDDYAARVFAMFGDEPFERGTRAIAYAWAGNEPVGSAYRNPVVEDVATIVLRSGNGAAGRWVTEDRDLVADFVAQFGEEPPRLTGIAVLVDTDDTDAEAIAWFDDFRLTPSPPYR